MHQFPDMLWSDDSIQLGVLVIESYLAVLESVWTLGYIDIQIIDSVFDLVPEIEGCRSIWTDKFLSVDEVPDNRFNSELLDEFTFQALKSGFSRFQSPTWETIESTSCVSGDSFAQIYFPFVDDDSTNFCSNEVWSIFHGYTI